MITENQIRKFIRQSLEESISNFIKPQEETATKQLDDNTKSQELGDPLFDIKMNQMSDKLGSDESNSPTVSVIGGEGKNGNGPTAGQLQANFSSKTKMA